ncbi:hypothetical protein VMCG_08856 [Cytospora schulzeri]|uniref:Heterokaryon incompatibility domain-containing protein n=1 Tax=Cytospora schulzeri TaxID=448051 RepID=A0A423VUL0_9PEZI|nr:hypothetical protein VMCG_08856 [Valsa malicola]
MSRNISTDISPFRSADWGQPMQLDIPRKLMQRDNFSKPPELNYLDGPDPHEIKLILTKDISTWTKYSKRVRYAALSYCWGTSHNNTLTTTPSNLQQHLGAIQISDLPRTLRETIWAARDLGIRYLWIDALCILQRERNALDHEEADADWQYESARMFLVYGNAFLTFVAAAAASSEEGLVLYKEPLRRLSGAPLTASNTPLHEEPISGRAWALQEWALSRRRLVFTKFGVHFICDHFGDRSLDGIRIKKKITSHSVYGSGWHQLVSDYCSRDLTFPRDKLTAFSGLAQRYMKLLNYSGKNYLAGLWRHRLAEDLLWHWTPHPKLLLHKPSNRGRHPGRAPTWSWASTDGNVDFESASRCPEMKIKKCQVELAVKDDFFGQVKSGVLKVSCLYVTTSFHRPDFDSDIWVGSNIDGFFLYPDDITELKDYYVTPELHCLQLGLGIGDHSRWNASFGIVVRFDNMKGAFTRVGFFRCKAKDFYTSDKQVFKIV